MHVWRTLRPAPDLPSLLMQLPDTGELCPAVAFRTGQIHRHDEIRGRSHGRWGREWPLNPAIW